MTKFVMPNYGPKKSRCGKFLLKLSVKLIKQKIDFEIILLSLPSPHFIRIMKYSLEQFLEDCSLISFLFGINYWSQQTVSLFIFIMIFVL